MSTASPVTILFVGDLHLGRRASRVPDAVLQEHGLAADVVTPVAAWRRTVDAALAAGVDAVALAGDLVHQDDDLFEARGHLEDGIRRLAGAGIRVCAVAGNHDTRVLPILADVIGDDLQLLGPGGTWSVCAVAPAVRIVGWSFPARHHAASPLADAPPPPADGVVTLGLLHADLDQQGSRYAPVKSAELLAVGYDGWALGHVHAPDPAPAAGARDPFYLGSISGGTPNETGAHGPVLATVADGRVTWERLPLAPLRWEHADVPVDDLGDVDPDDAATPLRRLLLRRIDQLARDAADPGLELLGLRLVLGGAHRQAAALARAAADLAADRLVTRIPDGPVVFVEKLTAALTAPVDLARLAERDDPPGLLARRLLALEAGGDGAAGLLGEARRLADGTALPGDAPPDDAELRRELVAAGQRALISLLAQDREVRP